MLFGNVFYLLFLFVAVLASDELNMTDISPWAHIFESDSLPYNGSDFMPDYMPAVGNGHLASTVFTDTVYVNGVYNGATGDSHRARIPSRINTRLQFNEAQADTERYLLDTRQGTFFARYNLTDWRIEQRVFAHRYFTRLLVTQFIFTQTTTEPVPLSVELVSDAGEESEDVDFDPPTSLGSTGYYSCGFTREVEDPRYQANTTHVCSLWMEVPDGPFTVTDTTTITIISAVDQSFDIAEVEFQEGLTFINDNNHEEFFNIHLSGWSDIWDQGHISTTGENLLLSKVIEGSQYYIWTSLPSLSTFSPHNDFYGLSPGSLAWGELGMDYQGHSFWDSETWMYPCLLLLWPSVAIELLNYRIRSIDAARDRATENGHNGARYPWESAFTGAEVTPDCCPETRENQIHITGDISFAARQLWATTRDLHWLMNDTAGVGVNGYTFIRDMAEFWVSRSVYNESTDAYDIRGVMPPDEDHQNVDNSVYTNVIAGMSIFFAEYASCVSGDPGLSIPDSWLTVARKLVLLYDSLNKWHPEFEGYEIGTIIKQADVVLLGFPLMYEKDIETRRNDLIYYENVTRSSGPAMTWSMHSIGHAELGNWEDAERLLNRSYQWYMREPFKVWTEQQHPYIIPDDSRSSLHPAVNFITAMGGFLQGVVMGYGGVRINIENLKITPNLPGGISEMDIRGVSYLGTKMDFAITEEWFNLYVTSTNDEYPLTLTQGQHEYPLQEELELHLPRETLVIKTSVETNCELPEDIIGQ